MALIVDAGTLYAHANRRDQDHGAILSLLSREREPVVTSEFVLAEADYLIGTRLGIDAELAFLNDVAASRVIVECLTREELGLARDLAQKYRDLRLGLADCSLVVLAGRHRTRRIATFNTRDFRTVTPIQGGAFTILPADL